MISYLESFSNKVFFFLLFLLTFLTYSQGLKNEFVYDDAIVIQKEERTFDPVNMLQVFQEPHYPYLPYYRPVTRLTFIFEKTFFSDPGPLVFHLTNIFIAAGLGIVIFKLFSLKAFKLPRSLAFVGALLFVLHPITSSAVYPAASGRETLLPVFLMALSLYYFFKGGKKEYLFSLLFFVLAIFGKEQAIVFPFILLFAGVLGLTNYRLGKHPKNWLVRYGPFFTALMVYLLLRWHIFKGQEYVFGNDPLLIVAAPLYALQQSLLPSLELRYEPHTISSWLSLSRLVLLLVGLVIIGWQAIQSKGRLKTLLFFVGIFFIALLPNANILFQEATFDERYILLSHVGVVGVIVTLLSRVWSAKSQLLSYCVFLIVILLAGISLHRATYFQNNLVFAQQWVATNPDYYLPHYNVARSYQEKGEMGKAIQHYKKSIELNPSFTSSYLNLGIVYYLQNNFKNAFTNFRQYIILEPDSPGGYYHLGLLFLQTEELERAREAFLKTVSIAPDFSEAYNNLGIVYEGLDEPEKAKEAYLRALESDPDNISARENLESLDKNP